MSESAPSSQSTPEIKGFEQSESGLYLPENASKGNRALFDAMQVGAEDGLGSVRYEPESFTQSSENPAAVEVTTNPDGSTAAILNPALIASINAGVIPVARRAEASQPVAQASTERTAAATEPTQPVQPAAATEASTPAATETETDSTDDSESEPTTFADPYAELARRLREGGQKHAEKTRAEEMLGADSELGKLTKESREALAEIDANLKAGVISAEDEVIQRRKVRETLKNARNEASQKTIDSNNERLDNGEFWQSPSDNNENRTATGGTPDGGVPKVMTELDPNDEEHRKAAANVIFNMANPYGVHEIKLGDDAQQALKATREVYADLTARARKSAIGNFFNEDISKKQGDGVVTRANKATRRVLRSVVSATKLDDVLNSSKSQKELIFAKSIYEATLLSAGDDVKERMEQLNYSPEQIHATALLGNILSDRALEDEIAQRRSERSKGTNKFVDMWVSWDDKKWTGKALKVATVAAAPLAVGIAASGFGVAGIAAIGLKVAGGAMGAATAKHVSNRRANASIKLEGGNKVSVAGKAAEENKQIMEAHRVGLSKSVGQGHGERAVSVHEHTNRVQGQTANEQRRNRRRITVSAGIGSAAMGVGQMFNPLEASHGDVWNENFKNMMEWRQDQLAQPGMQDLYNANPTAVDQFLANGWNNYLTNVN